MTKNSLIQVRVEEELNTDDFYNKHNMQFLEESAKRVANKENIVIKTMEQLEALENE